MSLCLLLLGDGTFTFEEFVSVMANMGGLDVNTDEDEEEELRRAFKVTMILADRLGHGWMIKITELRILFEQTIELAFYSFLSFDFLNLYLMDKYSCFHIPDDIGYSKFSIYSVFLNIRLYCIISKHSLGI